MRQPRTYAPIRWKIMSHNTAPVVVCALYRFVTLDDYFVDGLVHISELGRDYFQYDGARHMLLGERTGKRYRLADRLTVKLVRVDLDTRKIDLVPA